MLSPFKASQQWESWKGARNSMVKRVPSLLNPRSTNVQNTGLIECSFQSKASWLVLIQIPAVFASAWPEFLRLFLLLLLFGLDLMLIRVQERLLAELLAADFAGWLAASSAELLAALMVCWGGYTSSLAAKVFYSVLEACGHALLRGGVILRF